MFNHRLTRTAAVALTLAATAAPAAAMPVDPLTVGDEPTQDLRNADNRNYGTRAPVLPEEQPQDFRSPDTRDYADGRGTHNAPNVVVVDAPKPAAQPASTGIDWEDVGIGAGGLLGASLIAVGGALFVVHRRSPGPHAAAR
jgi:hypothetical protein